VADAAGEFARKLFAGPCDFIWGASNIDNLPPQSLKEVAFVGRSNVGKSSLINALTGRKTVARVSQTPGRTREINFFNLGGKLMLVDLPGYGYAKASRELAQEWQTLAFSYMSGRATLTRTLVLIDARRGIMQSDLAVMKLLDRAAVSYELVLTKSDEQKPDRLEPMLASVAAEARKHTAALAEMAATSAQTGAGIDALRAQLAALAPSFASERRV